MGAWKVASVRFRCTSVTSFPLSVIIGGCKLSRQIFSGFAEMDRFGFWMLDDVCLFKCFVHQPSISSNAECPERKMLKNTFKGLFECFHCLNPALRYLSCCLFR
ncbi:hypothetical protein XU18_2202 [Perkinsela sp. CCAP 1560/4]|nr:hypothetical protein XU18_2202 [Perkinsela sp. CCAP 1560/4]|eukprot:KNH07085.1 hypothetical protein XU18_2202 [Perkinsela sp. CCAP 1560/4]